MKELCNLCKSSEFKDILKLQKCIFSDGNEAREELIKQECQSCGTVRTKLKIDLEEFYNKNYKPSRNIDTVAIVDNEEIKRSSFIYSWIKELIPNDKFKNIKNIFEIGCGQGYLLDKFNIKDKFGIEPSKIASKIASNVAKVRNIGYEKINNSEKYDFVISYCVVEHIQNPNSFIEKKYNILNNDGIMCIALPIQDKFNYDLVFADHIHHFQDENFKLLLNKNGFKVINYELGKGSYFNIGIYICQKVNSKIDKEFKYIENKNIKNVKQIFKNIDKIIQKYKDNKIFAFGYGEIAKTIIPYTNLNNYISNYIDDYSKDKKVVTSEESKILFKEFDNITLLLLVNPIHFNKIKQLYNGFNINFVNIFENIEMDLI